MNDSGERRSKRFVPARWMERLLPVLMGIIFLALIMTLLVVVLAASGLLSGS